PKGASGGLGLAQVFRHRGDVASPQTMACQGSPGRLFQSRYRLVGQYVAGRLGQPRKSWYSRRRTGQLTGGTESLPSPRSCRRTPSGVKSPPGWLVGRTLSAKRLTAKRRRIDFMASLSLPIHPGLSAGSRFGQLTTPGTRSAVFGWGILLG